MEMQQQQQSFAEKVKVYVRTNYRNIFVRFPVVIGVIASLFAIMVLLTYGVELERLTWMDQYYSTTNALYIYFKNSAEYLLMLAIICIATAVVSFITAYIFDRKDINS